MRVAASSGYLSVVNRLLEIPAVLSAVTDNGVSVVLAAVTGDKDGMAAASIFSNRIENLSVMNHLLEIPKIFTAVTVDGNKILRAAAYANNLLAINRLLEFPEILAKMIVGYERES